MEMRSLTRCLRSRPTTSLLYTHQPTLLHGQFFANRQPLLALRFSSDWNSNSNSNRSPFPRQPPQQSQSRQPPNANANANDNDSIDHLLNELNLSTSNRSPSFLTRAANAASVSEHRRPRESSRNNGVELKLGPTLGRQVNVEPERGVDLSTALRRLNTVTVIDSIKVQSLKQKYHIRRGQAKKSSRIRRWRHLFRYSFSHTVSKIRRMRTQGW
ncbi:hypothetical protein BDW59DRAFT_137602 [Aspergillus cavernicola]|uniref:Ribosomal protein S21 n=1 Tax=Aspergillus cavernicola TaxID=176166 RepID=A0ABR4J2I9_9EURO